MGSKRCPSYACLFVGYQEYLISQSYTSYFPYLLLRYIDYVAGTSPPEQLQRFIDFDWHFNPALQCTVNITQCSLSFLDIDLSISSDHLNTPIYYEDSDAHRYLDYKSSHSLKCRNSIPLSPLLRLRHLCSEDNDFRSKGQKKCKFFSQFWLSW